MSTRAHVDSVTGRSSPHREARRRLAREQLPGLYAFARRLAEGDVEELLQETLARAWRSLRAPHDHRADAKRLRVILVTVWRERLPRQDQELDGLPLDDEGYSLYRQLSAKRPAGFDLRHVDLLEALSQHDLQALLARMPALSRAALILRYVEGFGPEEVAVMLALPSDTVATQLHRARQRFEQELWRYAQESLRE